MRQHSTAEQFLHTSIKSFSCSLSAKDRLAPSTTSPCCMTWSSLILRAEWRERTVWDDTMKSHLYSQNYELGSKCATYIFRSNIIPRLGNILTFLFIFCFGCNSFLGDSCMWALEESTTLINGGCSSWRRHKHDLNEMETTETPIPLTTPGSNQQPQLQVMLTALNTVLQWAQVISASIKFKLNAYFKFRSEFRVLWTHLLASMRSCSAHSLSERCCKSSRMFIVLWKWPQDRLTLTAVSCLSPVSTHTLIPASLKASMVSWTLSWSL